MTRRERLAARMQRRLEWAASREKKAAQGFEAARRVADNIPLGQPILIGHHSEGRHRRDIARIDSGMRQGVESEQMARHHEGKADGIAHALEHSIFSDDDNAIEALTAKITEMERERDAMKTANAVFKKAGGRGSDGGVVAMKAVAVAVGQELAMRGATTLMVCHYENRPFPQYALTNIGANIRRCKLRITEIGRLNAARAEVEASETGVVIHGDDYVSVRFADKPDRSVLDALRAAQFHWSGGAWCGYRAKLPKSVLDVDAKDPTQ